MDYATLMEALDVRRGDIVTLVGGGGKTTVMFRLAAEAASRGWKVLTTTTTNISMPGKSQSPFLVIADESKDVQGTVLDGLQRHGHVTVVGSRIRDDKLHGLKPEEVETLAGLAGVDLTVVEGDGARRRPLKVPAEHEPVIPSKSHKVLVLVGADALNMPLSDEVVHRLEAFVSLTGLKEGHELTPEIVALAVTHPEGGLKGVPRQARVWVVLNKVNLVDRRVALDFAHWVLSRPGVFGVLLVAWDSIEAVDRRKAAVLLAAGQGRRFGGAKQLAEIDGVPMARRSVKIVLNTEVGEVVVVGGYQADQLRRVLQGLPITFVENSDWAEGLASSVRAGLGALDPGVEAVLFCLGDQPLLQSSTVDLLLRSHRDHPESIIVPVFEGSRGNPVLFPRKFFAELSALKGDVGGRQVAARWPEAVVEITVNDPGILVDVDRPEDLATLTGI